MKQKTNIKGVSLIVLVITIIVMIIIAGAIIVSLSNGNVIEKAKEAVRLNNIKGYEEKLSLAYANWMLENSNTNLTNVDQLQEFDVSALPEGYGVVIMNGEPKIIEVHFAVDNVSVGDYVYYSANNYNSWRVLKIENGNVFLRSADGVEDSNTVYGEPQSAFDGRMKAVADKYMNSSLAESVQYFDPSSQMGTFDGTLISELNWFGFQTMYITGSNTEWRGTYGLFDFYSNGTLTMFGDTSDSYTGSVLVQAKLKSTVKVDLADGKDGTSAKPWTIFD